MPKGIGPEAAEWSPPHFSYIGPEAPPPPPPPPLFVWGLTLSTPHAEILDTPLAPPLTLNPASAPVYPGFQRGGCLGSGPIRKVGGAVHFRSDIRKMGAVHFRSDIRKMGAVHFRSDIRKVGGGVLKHPEHPPPPLDTPLTCMLNTSTRYEKKFGDPARIGEGRGKGRGGGGVVRTHPPAYAHANSCYYARKLRA